MKEIAMNLEGPCPAAAADLQMAASPAFSPVGGKVAELIEHWRLFPNFLYALSTDISRGKLKVTAGLGNAFVGYKHEAFSC